MDEAELEAQALAYRHELENYFQHAKTRPGAAYEGSVACTSSQPARGKELLAYALEDPASIPWDEMPQEQVTFALHGLCFIPSTSDRAAVELLSHLSTTTQANIAYLYLLPFVLASQDGSRPREERVPPQRILGLIELYKALLPTPALTKTNECHQ